MCVLGVVPPVLGGVEALINCQSRALTPTALAVALHPQSMPQSLTLRSVHCGVMADSG